jgi:Arm DNA-binding domain
MGRKGTGVGVLDNSIRLQFTLNGETLRRTLNVEGKPLPPTASNLRYAYRLAAEIRDRIRFGSFSLAEYFPADGDVAQPLTVALNSTTGSPRSASKHRPARATRARSGSGRLPSAIGASP